MKTVRDIGESKEGESWKKEQRGLFSAIFLWGSLRTQDCVPELEQSLKQAGQPEEKGFPYPGCFKSFLQLPVARELESFLVPEELTVIDENV